MAADFQRFGARPVATIVDALADALEWPRSRPARLLAGDRAQLGASLVLCSSDGALIGLDGGSQQVAVFAVPPTEGAARGSGRRGYDPFVGAADDVTSWKRADQVVLDAALLLGGGRGGVDERLAALVGLVPVAGEALLAPIRAVQRDTQKFVGYVPTDAFEAVSNAVFAAGAGTIGAYDMCSWSTVGTGSFRGGEGTNPAVGVRGELERTEETRFEVVAPAYLVPAVVRAYAAAHPYEEPAFDVLDMRLPSTVGFGRVGRLGPAGGGEVWNVLGALDPELTAHGRADHAVANALVALHTGAVRDVLVQLLALDGLALVVACSASDAEIDLLAERGIALLLIERSRAVEAVATDVAGMLTRRLDLPVTVAESLHFPTPELEHSAPTEPAAPDVFTQSNAAAAHGSPANADTATGTWRLHFDGGSRGNPGPAAYGWVLYDPEGNEAYVDGVRVGRATNNVAEWTGLLRGMEHAASVGVKRLAVRGDSELVIKQITGVYKIKAPDLKPIAAQVKAVIPQFEHVDFAHVYRADNARPDELANEAMDGTR
ncbi:MAG: ribonuclease HI/probable phosphoglycerate mutase [Thermoleophilia bacterium]|nr:ribonuclease HI/probable phosphoglycerate mutase [Thermoleophilia bacterium]